MLIELIKGLSGVVSGAVIGSYLATSALRWGKGEGASRGRSHCDHCQASLSFFETVPIVSWLVLKGQCRNCHSRIDPFHLIGEIAGAVILGLVFLIRPWPMAALEGLMGLMLLWLALIDIKTFTLPNSLVLAVAGLGGILAFNENLLVENGLMAIGMGLFLSALAWGLFRLKGQTALGVGDIKLIMALSLWLGLGSVYVLILASLFGLLHFVFLRSKNWSVSKVPFGPSLVLSGLMVGLFVLPAVGGAI